MILFWLPLGIKNEQAGELALKNEIAHKVLSCQKDAFGLSLMDKMDVVKHKGLPPVILSKIDTMMFE